MPETGKNPPTNERMLKVPPTLQEWKKTSHFNMITPHHQLNQQQTTSQPMAPPKNEIIVLTFQYQSDNELSVTIDGTLTVNLTLAEVMKLGLVCDEFNMTGISAGTSLLQTQTPERATSNENYKFLIKKK